MKPYTIKQIENIIHTFFFAEMHVKSIKSMWF